MLGRLDCPFSVFRFRGGSPGRSVSFSLSHCRIYICQGTFFSYIPKQRWMEEGLATHKRLKKNPKKHFVTSGFRRAAAERNVPYIVIAPYTVAEVFTGPTNTWILLCSHKDILELEFSGVWLLINPFFFSFEHCNRREKRREQLGANKIEGLAQTFSENFNNTTSRGGERGEGSLYHLITLTHTPCRCHVNQTKQILLFGAWKLGGY